MFSDSSDQSLEKIRLEIKNSEAFLVDIREQTEWEAGHIAGATHLPLSELKTLENLSTLKNRLPSDRSIYLYCQAGIRAQMAQSILQNVFPNVTALISGFEELKEVDRLANGENE